MTTTPTDDFIALLLPHLRYVTSDGAISITTELRDYGLDSKEAVDLLMDIEDYYEVAFPDALLTDKTFATAISLWQALAVVREIGDAS
jgi:acyl carrier protein